MSVKPNTVVDTETTLQQIAEIKKDISTHKARLECLFKIAIEKTQVSLAKQRSLGKPITASVVRGVHNAIDKYELELSEGLNYLASVGFNVGVEMPNCELLSETVKHGGKASLSISDDILIGAKVELARLANAVASGKTKPPSDSEPWEQFWLRMRKKKPQPTHEDIAELWRERHPGKPKPYWIKRSKNEVARQKRLKQAAKANR